MILTIVEILLLFVLPVLLIHFRIVHFRYRYVVLGVVTLIMLLVAIAEGWTFTQLGIRTDNLKTALLPYIFFTVAGISFVLIVSVIIGNKPKLTNFWTAYPLYLLSFIPACLIQEFGYRAILLPKLESIFTSIVMVIIIDALIFALLHVFYPDAPVLLFVTFIGGLGFAAIYYFYPNLILIFLSHTVLNFVMMLFSFFSKKYQ